MQQTDDIKARLQTRIQKLIECEKDKDLALEELHKCAKDPIYFINNWVWSYNPKSETQKIFPIKIFRKQEEYIIWLLERLEKKERGVTIKPREVGATWMCCAFAVWMFLFKDSISVTFCSNQLKMVDTRDDPDCIFSKIRQIIKYLPKFMKPIVKDKNFIILNETNFSTIKGAGGENPGRGGRSTIFFADEFAAVERQEAVEDAVTGNADTVIYLSTFRRPGNLFYRKATDDTTPKFKFSWWDDPRKTKEWYDKIKASTEPISFARNVECDPYASVSGALIKKEWIQASVNLWKSIKTVNPSIPIYAGYDPAGEGQGCEHTLVLRQGIKVSEIHAWKGLESHESAKKVHSLIYDKVESCYYDSDGGWGLMVKTYFKEIGYKKSVGVRGGFGSKDKRFLNMRAKLYWNLRDRFEATYLNDPDISKRIAIPDDGKLIDQLLSITISEREDGRIKVDSKVEMAKKGISSPDRADALVYSYASEFYKSDAIGV